MKLAELPNDWQVELARVTGFRHLVKVVYDPDGDNIDLTSRVVSMTPIAEEKEILFRSYRINDVQIEFENADEYFNQRVPTSFLYNKTWYKKTVKLYSCNPDCSSVIAQYTGVLLDVPLSEGHATFVVASVLKDFLDGKLLANNFGRIQRSGFGTGTLNGLTANQGACRIEEWTFEFSNATDFTCRGSLTGADGSGDLNTTFTSDSGAITVQPANWVGVFGAGTEVKIKTVCKSGVADEVFSLMLIWLQAVYGANLSSDEIDVDSFTSLVGSPNSMNGYFCYDRETNLITVFDELARHGNAVYFILGDGRIHITSYYPRLTSEQFDAICYALGLKSLSADHAPVYNQFELQYDYDDDPLTGEPGFQSVFIYPESLADNESYQVYGLCPAPKAIELRGASSPAFVRWIAEQFYARWAAPLDLYTVAAKRQFMFVDLADYLYMDSLDPERRTYVEPYQLSKRLAPMIDLEFKCLDAGFYLFPPGQCGYMFYDTDHRYDVCWVYW